MVPTSPSSNWQVRRLEVKKCSTIILDLSLQQQRQEDTVVLFQIQKGNPRETPISVVTALALSSDRCAGPTMQGRNKD